MVLACVLVTMLSTKFLRALGNSIASKRSTLEKNGNFSLGFARRLKKPVPTVHLPLPPKEDKYPIPFTKVGQIWTSLKDFQGRGTHQRKGEEIRVIGYAYQDPLDSEIPTHLLVVKRKTPDSPWSPRHYWVRLEDLPPRRKRYEIRYHPPQ